MTEILFLLMQGLVIGFVVSVPIGPVGTLCIKKTLELGIKGGLAVMVGAALSNTVYGGIASGGLAMVEQHLHHILPYFQIGGGAFLVYLGLADILKSPKAAPLRVKAPSKELASLATKATFIGLASPLAIIGFVSLFASLNLIETSIYEAVFITAGIALGSILWFILLTYMVATAQKKLRPSFIRYLGLGAGCVLMGFGAFSLGRGVIAFLG